ncbi:hypothetical protein L208DRAFT_1332634 [Tricholoma matsutake]|nr:hypothetical protein L208DRAFT_1332634 [Tricholoma matsutake 945]
MNPVLSKWLHSNSQLICPEEGFGVIDMAEWTMLLDMDDERYPSVGDWVTIHCGLYKGDVGYVWSAKNWGQITLLLVPRLPSPPMVGSSSGKRKQSGTYTDPCLLTKDMVMNFARNHGVTQFQKGEDNLWWIILGCKFEHALEVRTFHCHSVSSTSVSMPSSTFHEFKKAPHPDIMNATFPCPSEWKFSEGECVVDLEDGKGIVNVPWSNLRKYVAIGDFAEVTSGALCGEKGWVVEIISDEFDMLHNILMVGIWPNFCNQPLINLYQGHHVHINWVKVINPPLTFTKQQSMSSSTLADLLIAHPTHPFALDPSECAPWIKMEVVVCKVKHPMKGYRAIIKDVLPLQDNLCGLRITAQFTHINPAHPFKTEVLDYDNIVEVSYVTLISVGGHCE